jgi:hypothetical protein
VKRKLDYFVQRDSVADTNADGVYVIGKSGGMSGVTDSEVEQRRGRALQPRRSSDDSCNN